MNTQLTLLRQLANVQQAAQKMGISSSLTVYGKNATALSFFRYNKTFTFKAYEEGKWDKLREEIENFINNPTEIVYGDYNFNQTER